MPIPPPVVVDLPVAQPVPPSWREMLRRHWLAWTAIALIYCFVYLGSLSSPAIFDDADANHAEAAREMVATGDWTTLHIDGIRYLEKPPLPYWLVAADYKLFGISEATTRIPTALCILLLMFLAADWTRRAFGTRASIYVGLLVVTTFGYYLFTRILIPEALLSLTISGALYFALLALNEERRRSSRWLWYAAYAALALAVLAKGLVAIVFVGGTFVLYLVATGEWRRWRDFHLLTGTALLLLIAAPWHIIAGLRNPGFFWFYFVNEHFLRFLGRRYPKDYNRLPAIAYWSLHFVWLFPWGLFLGRVVENLRARAKERAAGRWTFADRTRLLCLIWSGLILVFFAISTNQEYYTLPAYLPLLLLAADALATDTGRSRWTAGAYAVISILGVAAGVALLAGIWSSRNLPVPADLGSVLANRQVAGDTLSMSKFFDLTGAAFAGLRLPALLAAIALLIGPGLALLWRRKTQRAVGMLAATSAVFLFAAHIALVRFGPFLSSKLLARDIQRVMQPRDEVVLYGDHSYGSSLNFYLQRQILLVNGRSTSLLWGSRYPDIPHIFLTDDDLLRRWSGPERIFLFVPPEQQARVRDLLGSQAHVFAEQSGKTVYTNRASN